MKLFRKWLKNTKICGCTRKCATAIICATYKNYLRSCPDSYPFQSEYLSFAATEGILKAGGRVINLGIATTPQLHFLTQQLNAGVAIQDLSMDYYYTFFSDAFLKLTKVLICSHRPGK